MKVRERAIKLKGHPTFETLKEWTQDMVTKVVVASDRTDNLAKPWVMRAKDSQVTLEQLGRTPKAFVRDFIGYCLMLSRIVSSVILSFTKTLLLRRPHALKGMSLL